MPAHDPLYDLVLMLDSAAPDEQRQRVLTGVETTIASGGEIVNTQDWGVRQMAYEIRHKADTEYHLLQFHGTRDVLVVTVRGIDDHHVDLGVDQRLRPLEALVAHGSRRGDA